MDILEFMTNCNQMMFRFTLMIFDNAGPDQVKQRKNKAV